MRKKKLMNVFVGGWFLCRAGTSNGGALGTCFFLPCIFPRWETSLPWLSAHRKQLPGLILPSHLGQKPSSQIAGGSLSFKHPQGGLGGSGDASLWVFWTPAEHTHLLASPHQEARLLLAFHPQVTHISTFPIDFQRVENMSPALLLIQYLKAAVLEASLDYHRITVSRHGRGWKGPLRVTQPNPLPKQGHPEQGAQHRGQAGLEYLQKRRLHSPSGQPGPGLRHPQREEVLPRVQLELPRLQFVPVAPCPVAGHHWKESGPVLLTPTLQIFRGILKVPSQPSLLQAEQAQLPQPLLVGEMLQSPPSSQPSAGKPQTSRPLRRASWDYSDS